MVGKDGKEQVCRTLPGVRGLKLCAYLDGITLQTRRTLPGVRGLKSLCCSVLKSFGACRTLPGVRGLKYATQQYDAVDKKSHPTRGAWIEILKIEMAGNERNVAPYPGCVD